VNEMNAHFGSALKREIKTLPNIHVSLVCYFISLVFLLPLYYVKYRVIRDTGMEICFWDSLGKFLIRYIE
jgi:hypothetical protein